MLKNVHIRKRARKTKAGLESKCVPLNSENMKAIARRCCKNNNHALKSG